MTSRVWKSLITVAVVMASICVATLGVVTNTAFATASPTSPLGQPRGAYVDTDPNNPNPHQDPRFLALKNAFRIRSGVTRGEPKGTRSSPYVTDTPWAPPAQPPASAATQSINARRANDSALGGPVGDAAHAALVPGAPSQPLTTDTYSWGYCNNCAEVPIDLDVQHLWEPGPGTYNHAPNFGPGTHSYDDNTGYYDDKNFYNLCGPGAADAAL